MTKEGKIRWNREFGMGTFLGDKGERFFDLSIRERVKRMAWSHACPISEKVVREYGEEWTLRRYAECNFVYGVILNEAAISNFSLYFNLSTPEQRRPGELPDPTIREINVPPSFVNEMSPLSTPAGYALPRILIEQFGRDKEDPNKRKRILQGLRVVDTLVRNPRIQDPNVLVVKLAEKVIGMKANPETVVGHLMCQEILNEEGCKGSYRQILEIMNRRAPKLKAVYERMLDEQRKGVNDWGIIDPADLK